MGDGIDAALLVQVRAAEEHEYPLAARVDASYPAGMAFDRGGREVRQVGHREIGEGGAEQVGRRDPPRAEDDRDVVAWCTGERGKGGC